jgi:photosystem II stability/assembly factor-like uncharacterized protein
MSANAIAFRVFAGALMIGQICARSASAQEPPEVPRALVRSFEYAFFVNPNRGYVWGQGTPTALLGTDDGGATWRLIMDVADMVKVDDSPLRRRAVIHTIHFLDANTFWTVFEGEVQQIKFSEDGGRILATLEPGPATTAGAACRGLFFRTATEGFAACETRLLRTHDGGGHWERIVLPQGLSTVWQVWMFDDREGIAVGRGVARTTDGGSTWEAVPGAPSTLRDVTCHTPSGFCAGFGGTGSRAPILLSRDRGLTWEESGVPLKAGGQDEVRALHAFAPNRLVVVGSDAGFNVDADLDAIARGTPAPAPQAFLLKWDGSTWTRITHAQPRTFAGAYFVDESNGWLLAYENQIYKTTDGGQTLEFVPDYFRQAAVATATAEAEEMATAVAAATATAEAAAEQTPPPEETP